MLTNLRRVVLVQSPRSKVYSLKSWGREHRTSNTEHRTLKLGPWLTRGFFLAAAGVMGVGLVKSYSRGAWVGAALGLAYLGYFVAKAESRKQKAEMGRGKAETLKAEMLKAVRSWLALAIISVAVGLLAFWSCRHTERAVARRATSVANANDFSWRKRVAAYEGALQMMADKPLLGFGWNQPQRVYDQFYRTPKVDEGAAIQLNDYFTLGTTLGIPALACFVAFIGLSLTRNTEHETRNTQTAALRPLTSDLWLPSVCRAAAIVLLVGFWFDGGLFKLATGATFWILLELGREAILGPGLLEVAPNANQIETRSLI